MSSMDDIAREFYRKENKQINSLTNIQTSNSYPKTSEDIVKFLLEHKDIDYATATIIEYLVRYSVENKPHLLKIAKERFDMILSK